MELFKLHFGFLIKKKFFAKIFHSKIWLSGELSFISKIKFFKSISKEFGLKISINSSVFVIAQFQKFPSKEFVEMSDFGLVKT
jgi:hypothetical protein